MIGDCDTSYFTGIDAHEPSIVASGSVVSVQTE
jgi:hypothetical protein